MPVKVLILVLEGINHFSTLRLLLPAISLHPDDRQGRVQELRKCFKATFKTGDRGGTAKCCEKAP